MYINVNLSIGCLFSKPIRLEYCIFAQTKKMALTETIPLDLGFEAPHFDLADPVNGGFKSLTDLKGENGTVVMFICNHCPFVIHIRAKLVELATHYQARGIAFIAINSNDVANYPDDSPEKMKEMALEHAFPFTYLFDETQAVARAYNAACTPDFSVFDSSLKCIYRGRLDDSTPGNGKPITGTDLSQSLDLLLADKPQLSSQWPSLGCSIKWK
jgi:peroxiredoxin